MRTFGMTLAGFGANTSGYAFAAHSYGHVGLALSGGVWLAGYAMFLAGWVAIEQADRK